MAYQQHSPPPRRTTTLRHRYEYSTLPPLYILCASLCPTENKPYRFWSEYLIYTCSSCYRDIQHAVFVCMDQCASVRFTQNLMHSTAIYIKTHFLLSYLPKFADICPFYTRKQDNTTHSRFAFPFFLKSKGIRKH